MLNRNSGIWIINRKLKRNGLIDYVDNNRPVNWSPVTDVILVTLIVQVVKGKMYSTIQCAHAILCMRIFPIFK